MTKNKNFISKARDAATAAYLSSERSKPHKLKYNQEGDYYEGGMPFLITVKGTNKYKPKYKWVSAKTPQLTLDNAMTGIDVATGPLFHLVLPSQYVGATRDLINGNNFLTSLFRGNSGVFNENFNLEHPYLGMFANGVVDVAALNKISTLLNNTGKSKSILSSSEKNLSKSGILDRSAKSADKILSLGVPLTFPILGSAVGDKIGGTPGVIAGDILGGILGFRLLNRSFSANTYFPNQYRKLNDATVYPASTALATLRHEYPWTKKLYFKIVRGWHNDIEKARQWLENSGYYRNLQPPVKILKHRHYIPGEHGHYEIIANKVVVQPTISPNSNLPLKYKDPILFDFKGVVNHELEHGRLKVFGGLSKKEELYWGPKNIDAESLLPFKQKALGTWERSPDEFDSELSNLLIMTGKTHIEPVDNIEPLARRFKITPQQARDLERDIITIKRDYPYLLNKL